MVGGSMVGMVQRTYHLLPQHLQVELDQFRNRLGLYASLVAVVGVLAMTASALVLPSAVGTGLGLTIACLVAAAAFYFAAISSADAYGNLLVEAMALMRQSTSTSV